MKRTHQVLAALVVALVTMINTTSSLADVTGGTLLAHVARLTPLNAFRGWLVWSDYDATIKKYRLIAYHGGLITRLPARASSVPFDVDLGPDRQGHVTAVYSRCTTQPRLAPYVPALPQYTRGRGCHVYELSLGAGKERLVRSIYSRHASDVLPTIWGGRIAFARVYPERPRRAGAIPHVMLGEISSRAVHSIRGGPLGTWRVSPHGRVLEGGPGPVSLDLRGRRLAVEWEDQVCCDSLGNDGPAQRVFIDGASGRQDIVARLAFFAPPVALGRSDVFFWGFSTDPQTPDQGPLLWRYNLKNRHFLEARTGGSVYTWGPATRDGPHIYYEQQPDKENGGADIYRTGGVVFARVKGVP